MDFSKIYCQTVDAEWTNAPLFPRLDNSHHIWCFKVSESASYFEVLKMVLTNDEIIKANKYRFQKDRDNFVVRRACLRILLGRYMGIPAESIVFSTGQNKRPILDPQIIPGLFFNLSHTDDLVLIAISDQEIGVDVEKINPDFNYSEILEHNFTPHEIDNILKSEVPASMFYTLWTRKEAILKASSKGIISDLKAIQCLNDIEFVSKDLFPTSWLVRSFKIKEQYIGGVASYMDSTASFFYAPLPEILEY